MQVRHLDEYAEPIDGRLGVDRAFLVVEPPVSNAVDRARTLADSPEQKAAAQAEMDKIEVDTAPVAFTRVRPGESLLRGAEAAE